MQKVSAVGFIVKIQVNAGDKMFEISLVVAMQNLYNARSNDLYESTQ